MNTTTTGTIIIHAASEPGLTCTVEYPSGITKEWSEDTLRRRGFEVPTNEPRRFVVEGGTLVENDEGTFDFVSDARRTVADLRS